MSNMRPPAVKYCPQCNTVCDRDEVDNGVGMQYGLWYCNGCGWIEPDILIVLNQQEKNNKQQ